MGVVTLVEGSTFCVSDEQGDIEPGGEQGLFVLDTRVLSTWRLRVDGRVPQALMAYQGAPFGGTFLGRAGALLVRRDRYVGNGLREDVTLRNTGPEASFAELTVEVGCDFADLFEVRARRFGNRGRRTQRQDEGGLAFEVEWRGRSRGCRVDGGAEAAVHPGELVYRVTVPARGEWRATLWVTASVDGAAIEPEFRAGEQPRHAGPSRRLARWRERVPRIETDDPALRRTYERSTADLASLRIVEGGDTAVAAGAPWYMTLFGRDSILAAYGALLLDPELALGTARMLSRY
jgi:glycogen debranching enzyme